MQTQDQAILQCAPQVLPHVFVGASTVHRVLSVLDFWRLHCGGNRDANRDVLSGALVLLHGALQQVKAVHKQGEVWQVELWRRQQPGAGQAWLVLVHELQDLPLDPQSLDRQAALCAEYNHAAMAGAAPPVTADKVMHVTLMAMRYCGAAQHVERAIAAMAQRQANSHMLHHMAVEETTKALTQQLTPPEADYLASLMKALQGGVPHPPNLAPAVYQQQANYQPPGHHMPYPQFEAQQQPVQHPYPPQHHQHQHHLQRHASQQVTQDWGTPQPPLQPQQPFVQDASGSMPSQHEVAHTTITIAAQPASAAQLAGQLPGPGAQPVAGNGAGPGSRTPAGKSKSRKWDMQQPSNTNQIPNDVQAPAKAINPSATQAEGRDITQQKNIDQSNRQMQEGAQQKQQQQPAEECSAFPFPVGEYKLAIPLPSHLLEAMQLLMCPLDELAAQSLHLEVNPPEATDMGQEPLPRKGSASKHSVQPNGQRRGEADGVAKVRTLASPFNEQGLGTSKVPVKEEVQDDLEEYLVQFVLDPTATQHKEPKQQQQQPTRPTVAQPDTRKGHAGANGIAAEPHAPTQVAPGSAKAQAQADLEVTASQQQQVHIKAEPGTELVQQPAEGHSPRRQRHASRSRSRSSSGSSSRGRSYSSSSTASSRSGRTTSTSRSRSPARSSQRHHKRKRPQSSSSGSSRSRSPSRSQSPRRVKGRARSRSRGRRGSCSSRHRSRSQPHRSWSRKAPPGGGHWHSSRSRSPSRDGRRFVRGPFMPRSRSPRPPGYRMGPPPPGWSPVRRPPLSPRDDVRVGPAPPMASAPVALRTTADGRLVMDIGEGGVSSSEGEHSSQEEEEGGVFRTKKRWKMPPPRAGIPKFCPRMDHIERWDPVNDPDPVFVKAARRGSPPRPYLGRPPSPGRLGPYGPPRSPPRNGMLGGYSPPPGRRDMPSPRWRDGGEPWHGGRGRSPPPRGMGGFSRGLSPPRLGYRGSPPPLPYDRSPPRSYGGFDRRPGGGYDHDQGGGYDRGRDLGPGGERGYVHEIKARLQRGSGQSSGWR